MPSTNSSTDRLASSLHRTVLGVMLGLVALFTTGWGVHTLSDGNLLGLAGLVVGFGAAYWILDLFKQGLREA